MIRRNAIWLLGSVLCFSAALVADDVSNASQMVCSLQMAASCDLDGQCEEGAPMEWNVPSFIVLDVDAETMSTTAAELQPRATKARYVDRVEGLLYLQGVENERAFSIVVDDESGLLSATITTPGFNVSVFGSCTPLPVEPAGS